MDPHLPQDGRLRVAQWATGDVGAQALRAILDHPDLRLVGVLVHDRAKVGRDAGELCGTGATTGVCATAELADILAAQPDCVLYMPRLFDVDQVCALLAAGIDVVTTHGEPRHPASMDPRVCARIEAACWYGGASLLSTGVAPGFVTETLPVALSPLHRRVDSIAIEESVDLTTPGVSRVMVAAMGFGTTETTLGADRLRYARRLHEPSLRLLADALRLPLDTVDVRGETAVAADDLALAETVIRAGTVAAQRITVAGSAAGREILRFRSVWYCRAAPAPGWTTRETGWHLTVAGETPVELFMRYDVEPDRLAAVSPRYAANRAVNAVTALRAAPPGIRTTRDLPASATRFG
ncbi:NAD(P)H-dependent amine dehydrogenase family protein [Nocardia takedensis]